MDKTNRWMVGREKKIKINMDVWMDRKIRWMVGYKNVDGYKNIRLDGQKKMDGWMDKKQMDGWMDRKKNKMDG